MSGEDLKIEIGHLQKAMFKTFVTDGELPIYDPESFINFCKKASAENVFYFILSSISSDRHSKDRKELNKKRAVALLYQLYFSLSQRCDNLHKDNGLFLKFCHLTDEGIDTQRVLGTAVCSRSVKREIVDFSKNSSGLFNDIVKDAIENNYLVALMIDEWTKVYTKRRPTDETTSVADNFCTIIIKVTKDIKAIPRTEHKTIHNPVGIDV